MRSEELRLACGDGVTIPATAYEPERPAAVLVIASAMGVPRRFYRAFAGGLAARGIATLTFDYRGIGDAAASVADPRAARLTDWGTLDLHAALEQAHARWAGVPAFLLGHSVGAQLVGLTPLSERLAGLVFVAGSRPHLSVDPGARKLFTALWWHVIVPLASRGRWFPARKLKFAPVDVPSGVARDWGRYGRRKRYLFDPVHGIDIARYARLELPLLAYSFSDDPYCPPKSAEGLLEEYPRARLTRRHVRPGEAGVNAIGHAGFFRDSLRDTLWKETADWLLAAGKAR